MMIQKLNNSTSYPLMKPSFGDNTSSKLSDEQIRQIALAEPRHRLRQVQKNSVYTLMVGLPLVDSLLAGAMTHGSLAKKSAKYLGQQGRWLGVFAVGSVLFGLKRFVNKKSQALDNFNKNHPVLSTGVDFAALYGSLIGVHQITSSLKNLVNKRFPKLVDTFNNQVLNRFAKALNNSTLNKKYVETFDTYLAKNKYAKKAGTLLAITAAPVIAIATLVRFSREAEFAATMANNNYVLLNIFNSFLPEKPDRKENIDV